MMLRAARVAAPLAGLAAAIQLENLDNVAPEVKTINSAMRALESMWPGGQSLDMLEDIMTSIQPLDSGAALQKKLLNRYGSKRPFVFAAFGSSVSAGHDNLQNQSWPIELERLLKPTFQALGFDFEMRHRAAGGYGEMPFAAGCMSSRAGRGLDAVSWEWHMFYDAPCEGHHFLQEAAAADGRPLVFAFAGSGINFDDNLECTSGTPQEKCHGARADLRDKVLTNTDESFHVPRDWKPSNWYRGENFVSNAELERFKAESSKVFHVKQKLRPLEEMVWLQRTGVAAQFENEGGSFYPISINAAVKYVINDPWYQVREKAFNVNWHPGPLGHTLIASAIGHYMLANLKLALTSDESRSKGPSLDNPLVGKPISGTIENPQCGNLKSLKCTTGMHPAAGGIYMDSHRDTRANHSWEYKVSRQAAEARVPTVDERWVYSGTRNDGELKLFVETDADDQYVVVCGAPCGWRCDGNAGWVSSRSQRWWFDKETPRPTGSDLAFTIDGRKVPQKELVALHDTLFFEKVGKFCPDCKNPADLCQPVAKVSKGKHTIGATVAPSSRAAKPGPEPPGLQEEMYVEIFEVMVVG